jgi:hypothetical protein
MPTMVGPHALPPVVLATLTPSAPGNKAVGVLTFDEAPPADGAVVSDNPAVATVALAADLITWTVTGVSIGNCTVSFTGTSLPPDVGPVQVAPMAVTVAAAPVAETGNFNPATAVIT